jgi:MATE family multidrug resistance protein
MIANLVGYWMIGLPVGYVLCFHFHLGVYGLWWGLTMALVVIAGALLYTWGRESREILSPAFMRWSEPGAPAGK